MLYFFEGRKLREISVILDISPKTAHEHIQRSKEKCVSKYRDGALGNCSVCNEPTGRFFDGMCFRCWSTAKNLEKVDNF